MAGDWIKMRADLFTHPKVVRIASALKADTLRTVGGLMSVWCLFDAHSEDGRLEGYTPDVLDAHLRCEGFANAMMAVGWLEHDPEYGLVLPRFDTHNGQSAKRRAQDADRKREVRKTSAPEADKRRTREEKRREDISLPANAGSEGAKPRPARKCPADFEITSQMREWAAANAALVNIDAATESFRDHTFKNAISDWVGAWRNWLRRENKYAAEKEKPPARRRPASGKVIRQRYGDNHDGHDVEEPA